MELFKNILSSLQYCLSYIFMNEMHIRNILSLYSYSSELWSNYLFLLTHLMAKSHLCSLDHIRGITLFCALEME